MSPTDNAEKSLGEFEIEPPLTYLGMRATNLYLKSIKNISFPGIISSPMNDKGENALLLRQYLIAIAAIKIH